jgi:KDO2-lipid IV(A) lauroyltransferase
MRRDGSPVEDAGGLPAWRRWRRGGYHALARAVAALVAAVPEATGRALCETLAAAALLVRGTERRRAERNLALAFPHLEPDARRRLLRRSALALGANLHAALRLERIARDDFREVRCEASPGRGGVDALTWVRRLRAEGRGVLILTGHLGCWELLGAFLARRLGGIGVVTGTVHNPPLDAWLQGRRRRLGMQVLPREGGVRPLLALLRRGGVAAVLLDQNVSVASEPVPFLGRPAPTATGLARIATRYGIPVLPVAVASDRREGRGDAHVVSCLPPLRPSHPAGEAAVTTLTAACNEALGHFVRRNPVEWVWFHDRWGVSDQAARSPDEIGSGRPGNVADVATRSREPAGERS